MIGPDPANWVPDRPGVDHNVAIVGGGQTGCALAFALRRAGIGKVTILEAAPNEDRAGIWLNAARMTMLRTPKSLPGPELGIPALGFQAWYEARHGQDAYASIERIKRTDWAEYLNWYKRFLGIAPRYSTHLARIEPADDHFRLHLETPTGTTTETARKIILATGFRGGGDNFIPDALTNNLPPSRYSHTEDRIDFASLRGRTVGVIGAAASAFDAAGLALEHGAAAVHLFCRRDAVAATPVIGARNIKELATRGEHHFIVEIDLVRARARSRLRHRVHRVVPTGPVLEVAPVRRPSEVSRIDIRGQPFLESMQLVGPAEMHLAAEHSLIAGMAQVMGKGWHGGRQFRRVIVAANPGGQLSGEK